jgi:hypothetical protein
MPVSMDTLAWKLGVSIAIMPIDRRRVGRKGSESPGSFSTMTAIVFNALEDDPGRRREP